MVTTTNTFLNIFDAVIEIQGKSIRIEKIEIPMIQRDYAQGRKDIEIERVRRRFIEALYLAITETPITLDFIYGDINEQGVMIPLDGQQRLTTLFLLHWYAVKKENIELPKDSFLTRFGYETRFSARNFCSRLAEFKPSFSKTISDEIVDQNWFPLDWKNDQTIDSMLVIIDALDNRFNIVHALWKKLVEGAISFYFLPIEDMGLTDELYIKMNSRGKPLTLFEHFKAELAGNLNEIDKETAKRILEKIDVDWTDMLWRYRSKDYIIDDEFLRYFRFICDILCYKSGNSPQNRNSDEFELLKEYFSKDNEYVLNNINDLEGYFNCWLRLTEDSPDAFLEKYISHWHETGKIRVEMRYEINIFKDCLQNYSEIIGGRNRKFPLNRIVLIYSIVVYLLHKESISEAEFIRRLRIVNNLTQNSVYEISDSETRVGGNRMPAILRQVDSIMITGAFSSDIESNFNVFQIEEEEKKLMWCASNSNSVEALFELEDHPLLYGQISIVGLDILEHLSRFKTLFDCNWDKIDCALLACGDYKQTERNGWRFQFGTKNSTIDAAWKNLFHKSSNNGYEKTTKTLNMLLSKTDKFTNEILHEIACDYLSNCEMKHEYDWKYYYVKYPSFRLGRHGKYIWLDYASKPYKALALWTESYLSSNARQPFLYEIDSEKINRDDYGESLQYGSKIVKCENSAFVVYDNETKSELARIDISQNYNGIDVEDRIIKGKKEIPLIIASLLSK